MYSQEKVDLFAVEKSAHCSNWFNLTFPSHLRLIPLIALPLQVLAMVLQDFVYLLVAWPAHIGVSNLMSHWHSLGDSCPPGTSFSGNWPYFTLKFWTFNLPLRGNSSQILHSILLSILSMWDYIELYGSEMEALYIIVRKVPPGVPLSMDCPTTVKVYVAAIMSSSYRGSYRVILSSASWISGARKAAPNVPSLGAMSTPERFIGFDGRNKKTSSAWSYMLCGMTSWGYVM